MDMHVWSMAAEMRIDSLQTSQKTVAEVVQAEMNLMLELRPWGSIPAFQNVSAFCTLCLQLQGVS